MFWYPCTPGSHQDHHQHCHRSRNPQQPNHHLQHDDDDDLPIGISSAHNINDGDEDDDAAFDDDDAYDGD